MKLIAETAWHHDGNYEFFKNLVSDISQKTEADYVKLHISLDLDEYIHSDHPGYNWMGERMFCEDEWDEIFNIILSNNKKLMLLFNDKKAIDFGMKYNPELVELHSVCLNDRALLEHLKKNIHPTTKIVLGVGGSDLYEIENAVDFLDSRNVILMHGFQNYPTQYSDINFGKIAKIMQLYSHCEHGYADHTAWNNEHNVLISLLGAGLGMTFVEKHVTNVYGEDRVDWQAAISISMFNEIYEKLKVVKQSFGDAKLKLNQGEKSYSVFGPSKKAAILKTDVKKGNKLKLEHFSFKRTGQSSDLSQLDIWDSVGKTFQQDLASGHCLNSKDLG